jgi:hypothetical protein
MVDYDESLVSFVEGIPSEDLSRLARSEERVLRQVLAVYVVPDKDAPIAGLPPMMGSVKVKGGALEFRSAYKVQMGLSYRVVFRPALLAGTSSVLPHTTSVFTLPKPALPRSTVVKRIYPTADRLPENLLKFYVHFSAPMSRGRIYDHIRLLDNSGKAVELPFLEIDEELWDPTMTRLTLFIDPGRIKREVKPLEEIGPALEAGKTFTLEIDRGWQDSAGNPLMYTHRKVFQVGPPDRDPPDPDQWRIQKPGVGRGPLVVRFPKPMDSALAIRFLWVTTEAGSRVAGTSALSDHETVWSFTPKVPWKAGGYRLVVRTAIEDLAGNNIGKPFEVDLFDTVERSIRTATIKLPFEVR